MQCKVKVWSLGYALILVYWIMISVNANFIDSSSNMFYVAVAVGLVCHVALRIYALRGRKADCLKTDVDRDGHKFKKLFYFFIGLNIFYVILSFLGFGSWFGIEGLGFERRYIVRHAYYLFTIPIGYTFAMAAYEGFWHRLNIRVVLYVLYITAFLASIYSNAPLSSRALIIGIASLLYIKKKNLFHLALIPLAIAATSTGQAAAYLGGMMLLVILLFPQISASLLGKSIRMKFVVVFSLVVLVVAVFFAELYQFIYRDANSLWRLFYWMNDAEVLVKTRGIGVGFGAAYATTELLTDMSNTKVLTTNMFIREGYTMEGALFITAQHSSLVNMFYRLGVVGGFVFIFLHLRLLTWFRNLYRKCKQKGLEKEQDYVVWAISNFLYHFVIIVLNPGIESPVFFWGYLVFAGITIGMFYRTSALIKN